MATSDPLPHAFSTFMPDPPPDLLRSVARSMQSVDSEAPPSERVDAVVGLAGLANVITEHNRRVMAGESKESDWLLLADILAKATQLCRMQITPELRDIGDSGGR